MTLKEVDEVPGRRDAWASQAKATAPPPTPRPGCMNGWMDGAKSLEKSSASDIPCFNYVLFAPKFVIIYTRPKRFKKLAQANSRR